MTFGEKIKQLRMIRGWSQYELAKRAGIPRGSLASIESDRSMPKTDILLKLARALGIVVEELYEAAGYEIEAERKRPVEKPEEIIERLMMVQPVSIPVYRGLQPYIGGTREEPVKYIFRRRELAVGRNIEAYIIRGQYLSLEISDGDVALVDRDLAIEAGDMVLCLYSGQTSIGVVEMEGDELWVVVDGYKVRLKDCQASAKVIEIRIKKSE